MSYEFNNNLPIYKQIMNIITLEIISDKILPGQKLLSIREYSEKFNVNANTVQRALVELEKDGLIFTERTNGKFITQDVNVIKSMKAQIIKQKVDDFFQSMISVGLDVQEIKKLINDFDK